MEDEKAFSLETTLTGQAPFKRMLEAKAAGYHIELRFLALRSPNLHIVRVQERVRKGGHAIPTDTIRRRYARSLDNLPKAVELADRGFVFDNSGDRQQELLRTISLFRQ